MTFRRFALAATPAVRTGAVLSLLAIVGFAVSAASPEAVVTQRFAAALEAAPSTSPSAARQTALVSGTEAYWLSGKRRLETGGAALEPAAWSGPLAAGLSIGDRITISGKTERVLEVVAIADVAPHEKANEARQIAITCRDTSTPGNHLVTFIAPAEASGATKSARAL